MSCYSEKDIIPVALEVIKANPGIRTSSLIDKVRFIMKPTGEDREILKNRSDDKFSQKVRNIKSHNQLEGIVETTDEIDCQWFYKGK